MSPLNDNRPELRMRLSVKLTAEFIVLGCPVLVGGRNKQSSEPED